MPRVHQCQAQSQSYRLLEGLHPGVEHRHGAHLVVLHVRHLVQQLPPRKMTVGKLSESLKAQTQAYICAYYVYEARLLRLRFLRTRAGIG